MNYKDILAKLLATENITIVREPTSTASFDVVNRVLVLPNWKDLEPVVEDLFIFHEIGHALFTGRTHVITDVINILEDNRIERLLKTKFPASVKTFRKGYETLVEKGFFGPESDWFSYSTIDKLNIVSKLGITEAGHILKYHERIIFNEINALRTYEEVLTYAEKMGERLKTIKQLVEEAKSYVDADLEESKSAENDGEADGESGDPLKSVTLGINVLEIDQRKVNNINLNKPFRVAGEYFGWRKVYIKSEMNKPFVYNRFKESAVGLVDSMVSTFMSKKSAEEFARRKTFKTGHLQTSKLHKYKYTDNIFKTNTIVNEGQNHGMILVLDGSGSMKDVMSAALKQIILVASFCRKANIPFKVVKFNDNRLEQGQGGVAAPDNFTYAVRHSELLTSDMNNYSFEQCCKILLDGIIENVSGNSSGTPLISSLYATKLMADTFRKERALQKVSIVYFTDGGESTGYNILMNHGHKADNIIYHDYKLGTSYPENHNYPQIVNTLYRWMQDSGYDVIRFHVTNLPNGNDKVLFNIDEMPPWDNDFTSFTNREGHRVVFVSPGLFLSETKVPKVQPGEEGVINRFTASFSINAKRSLLMKTFVDSIS